MPKSRSLFFGLQFFLFFEFVSCSRLIPDQPVSVAETQFALKQIAPYPPFDQMLQAIVATVTARTSDSLQIQRDSIATLIRISVIDLTAPRFAKIGSYRCTERVYPASVVKAYYLVATYFQIQQDWLRLDAALRRDIAQMIVVSDNRATQRILDRLTATVSGPELSGQEFVDFVWQRNWVNRYFHSLGFDSLNVNQKTWDELPDGRERQFLGAEQGQNFVNSNKLTTDETAELFYLIELGKVVSPRACHTMKKLLRRTVAPGSQFINGAVPIGTRIWAKAGYTDSKCHDAAILHLANGKKLVLVIFTDRVSGRDLLLHSLAQEIVTNFLN